MIVLAIHDAGGKDVTFSEVAYSLVTGGGKPGQGYPCVVIAKEKQDDLHRADSRPPDSEN